MLYRAYLPQACVVKIMHVVEEWTYMCATAVSTRSLFPSANNRPPFDPGYGLDGYPYFHFGVEATRRSRSALDLNPA